MKTKNFMVLDTETSDLRPNNFIYDLGYVIATRNEILCERNFIVKEIITNPTKMLGAFYARKIFSFYIPRIALGMLPLVPWQEIVEAFRKDFENFEVDVISAYNLDFDKSALDVTNKLLGTGNMLKFKPQLLDLWMFACTASLNSRLYHQVAADQDWISDKGNVRTTAEKAYAFITGELDYVEQHTALADAKMETVILQRLLAKKQTIPYDKIDSRPWRYAQTFRGEL